MSTTPSTWRSWWLSFADATRPKGTQFLGACIVGPAHCFLHAIALSHAHGCNPGGECQGVDIPVQIEPRIPAGYRNRLLSKAEAEGFDRAVGWTNN